MSDSGKMIRIFTSGGAVEGTSGLYACVGSERIDCIQSIKLSPADGDGALRANDIVMATIEVAVQLGDQEEKSEPPRARVRRKPIE